MLCFYWYPPVFPAYPAMTIIDMTMTMAMTIRDGGRSSDDDDDDNAASSGGLMRSRALFSCQEACPKGGGVQLLDPTAHDLRCVRHVKTCSGSTVGHIKMSLWMRHVPAASSRCLYPAWLKPISQSHHGRQWIQQQSHVLAAREASSAVAVGTCIFLWLPRGSSAMAEPWRGLLHQLSTELERQSAKLRDLELQNKRLLAPSLDSFTRV